LKATSRINDAAVTAVDERVGVLDAKIAEQARRVSDVEKQDREIADVIGRMTSTGQTKTALTAITSQQARRDAIGKGRQEAADKLVDLKAQRSHLEAEAKRVFAETGSARFLAAQLGTDAETVIRWLVMALVMMIDPTAIVLTVAATRRLVP
jgi:predicted metal-binding membrane protein